MFLAHTIVNWARIYRQEKPLKTAYKGRDFNQKENEQLKLGKVYRTASTGRQLQ